MKIQHNHNKVKHLRRIAFLLDNAITIPLINYRIGLDPLLGLLGILGGSGDFVGGLIGAYIVVEATKMGLPNSVIWQMVGNIALDSVAGLVPGLGDILDFAWKANSRNIALIEQHLDIVPQDKKLNPLFLLVIVVILAVIVLGIGFLAVMLIKAIFNP